jgi:hypothetical protein
MSMQAVRYTMSHLVLLTSYQLQVIWIAAQPIFADMVQMITFKYPTFVQSPRLTMRGLA